MKRLVTIFFAVALIFGFPVFSSGNEGEEIPLDDFPVFINGFRLQVGAFATEKAAVALRDSLKKSFSVPVCLHFSEGLWKVRVGAFTVESEARRFLEDELISRGFSDARVVPDKVPAPAGEGFGEKAPGFRIQVNALDDRQAALRAARDLDGKYPRQRTYVVKQDSLYKILFGDFRSRSETEKWLTELKSTIAPEAWVVPGEIYVNPPPSPLEPPHTDPLDDLDD